MKNNDQILERAIMAWSDLVDDAERRAALGLTHPSTANAQASAYRRTVRALEIERDTGVAVCSCCHKPLGKEKPVWLRGATVDNEGGEEDEK